MGKAFYDGKESGKLKNYHQQNLQNQSNNPQILIKKGEMIDKAINQMQAISPIKNLIVKPEEQSSYEAKSLLKNMADEAALDLLNNNNNNEIPLNTFNPLFLLNKSPSPLKRKRIFQLQQNHIKFYQHQHSINEQDLGCSFFSQYIPNRSERRSHRHSHRIFTPRKRVIQDKVVNKQLIINKNQRLDHQRTIKNNKSMIQSYEENRNKVKKLGGKQTKRKINQQQLNESIEVKSFHKSFKDDSKIIKIKIITNNSIEPLQF